MDGQWAAQVIDPIYIVARAALLDALDALADQRGAVILVGAQAIYLHTGDADIAIPGSASASWRGYQQRSLWI
jgi:hypothetical protein